MVCRSAPSARSTAGWRLAAAWRARPSMCSRMRSTSRNDRRNPVRPPSSTTATRRSVSPCRVETGRHRTARARPVASRTASTPIDSVAAAPIAATGAWRIPRHASRRSRTHAGPPRATSDRRRGGEGPDDRRHLTGEPEARRPRPAPGPHPPIVVLEVVDDAAASRSGTMRRSTSDDRPRHHCGSPIGRQQGLEPVPHALHPSDRPPQRLQAARRDPVVAPRPAAARRRR